MTGPPVVIQVNARGRRRPEKPASRRERIAALRHLPALAKLIWETHRGYTVAMMLLRLSRAFVPVATFWVGKLILDTVIAVRDGQADIAELWRYIAIEVAIVVTGEILARGSSLIESLLSDLFSNRMSVRLMEHAATLDLAQFEDPTFYDH